MHATWGVLSHTAGGRQGYMGALPHEPSRLTTIPGEETSDATVLAGNGLIVTADKTPDGGAAGRTDWDRAASWPPGDYPPRLLDEFPGAREADGEQVSTGRYPVLRISSAWELW